MNDDTLCKACKKEPKKNAKTCSICQVKKDLVITCNTCLQIICYHCALDHTYYHRKQYAELHVHNECMLGLCTNCDQRVCGDCNWSHYLECKSQKEATSKKRQIDKCKNQDLDFKIGISDQDGSCDLKQIDVELTDSFLNFHLEIDNGTSVKISLSALQLKQLLASLFFLFFFCFLLFCSSSFVHFDSFIFFIYSNKSKETHLDLHNQGHRFAGFSTLIKPLQGLLNSSFNWTYLWN